VWSAAAHLPGTAADFAFRLGLKTTGLNIKDVKTVMVGGSSPRIAAVKTGQLDFTVVTGSGKVEGEKAGLKVIVDMAKNEFAISIHLYNRDRKNDS
jgi:ABC-type nitrate/sulfonate/bicarbonate transport system substrate-binding protein